MTDIIETLPGEHQDLSLHVSVCEQRYHQLVVKIGDFEHKLSRIETLVEEIDDKLNEYKNETLRQYLTWGGAIIAALCGILGTLIVKYVL